MRALVTGSSGFVGSALCSRLRELGHEVFPFDRPVCEVTSFDSVLGAVSDAKPDIVYHLAAKTEVRSADRATYLTNVLGTLNILAANKFHVVVASSDKAYGKDGLCSENDEMRCGADLYSLSKKHADELARHYGATVVRPCNIYGPGQRNTTTLITRVVVDALKGRPVQMHCGWVSREWLYIDDVVEAYILIGRMPGVYNVGSGECVSVERVIQKVLRLIPGSYECVKDPPLQQHQDQSLDSSRFWFQFPGWHPTPFDEGLAKTIAWYKEHVNEFD